MAVYSKINSNGFSLPIFGLGTWTIGGTFQRDINNKDEGDIQAIRNAITEGITHIDTAESYAAGHSERLVGEAIKGYDRSKLFIVSKVSSYHLRYDDVIKSAKASLARLETDYLDLYLIHSPSDLIPQKETMQALDTLKDNGLIKEIGVSNFAVARMQEAQSFTQNKIVANQVHYNLIYREPEAKGLLKYCQENEIFLIAWRPVQKGVLAREGTKIVDELCLKYSKSPAQIAINWLISQPFVVTLAAMRNQKHLEENLGALGWSLSLEDVERLRQYYPHQQHISDDVPLS